MKQVFFILALVAVCHCNLFASETLLKLSDILKAMNLEVTVLLSMFFVVVEVAKDDLALPKQTFRITHIMFNPPPSYSILSSYNLKSQFFAKEH